MFQLGVIALIPNLGNRFNGLRNCVESYDLGSSSLGLGSSVLNQRGHVLVVP